MPDKIEFTAQGSGYYIVYLNDVHYSQHTTEREACEVSGHLKRENPDGNVKYIHDYEVDVSLLLGFDGGAAPADPIPPSNPLTNQPIITAFGGDAEYSLSINDNGSENYTGIRVFEDGVEISGSPFVRGTDYTAPTLAVGPITSKTNGQTYTITAFTYFSTTQQSSTASVSVTPQSVAEGSAYALLTPTRLADINASIATDNSTWLAFKAAVEEMATQDAAWFGGTTIYRFLAPAAMYFALGGTDATVQNQFHDKFLEATGASGMLGTDTRSFILENNSKAADTWRANISSVLYGIHWYEKYSTALAIFTSGELATIKSRIQTVIENHLDYADAGNSFYDNKFTNDSDWSNVFAGQVEIASRYFTSGDGAIYDRIVDVRDHVVPALDRSYVSANNGHYYKAYTTSPSYNSGDIPLLRDAIFLYKDRGGALENPNWGVDYAKNIIFQLLPTYEYWPAYNDYPGGTTGTEFPRSNDSGGYTLLSVLLQLTLDSDNENRTVQGVLEAMPAISQTSSQWLVGYYMERLLGERRQNGTAIALSSSGWDLYWHAPTQMLARSSLASTADYVHTPQWPMWQTHHHGGAGFGSYDLIIDGDVTITRSGAGGANLLGRQVFNTVYFTNANSGAFVGFPPNQGADKDRGAATYASLLTETLARNSTMKNAFYGDSSVVVTRQKLDELWGIGTDWQSTLSEHHRSKVVLHGPRLKVVYDAWNSSDVKERVRRFPAAPTLGSGWYSATYGGATQYCQLFTIAGTSPTATDIVNETTDAPFSTYSSNHFYDSQRAHHIKWTFPTGANRVLEVTTYETTGAAAPTQTEAVTINSGNVDAYSIEHDSQWYVFVFNRSYQPVTSSIDITLGSNAVVAGAIFCFVGFDDAVPFAAANPAGKQITLTAESGTDLPNAGQMLLLTEGVDF